MILVVVIVVVVVVVVVLVVVVVDMEVDGLNRIEVNSLNRWLAFIEPAKVGNAKLRSGGAPRPQNICSCLGCCLLITMQLFNCLLLR